MKRGRRIAALLLATVAAGAMAAGFVACGENDDNGQLEQTTVAEKIKDGGAVVLADGRSTIDLTQYVKANGNEYRVAVSNKKVVTATISGNTLTVTEVGTGSAIITVACGDVRLTFSVVVFEAFYTVTIDGVAVPPATGDKWAAGSSYTLPAGKKSDDPNMEFRGWNVNGETKQAGETVTVNKNLTITAVFARKAAEEVREHAQSVSLNEGKTIAVSIADYITAYGREVTAGAAETDVVSVSVEDGFVTLTGVAEGTATLTLSTEGVTVNLEVIVLSADMPTFANATLEVDLFTQTSNSFVFAPQEPSEEHAYAYVYTLRTQDARASLAGDTLTFTPEADHDIEEDGAAFSLIVDAAVTMDGAAAGTVTFTVIVRIKDSAPEAPEFANVEETFDPFADNGYTLLLKAEDENFIYTYEIGGIAVTGSKVYTAEAEETVNVTYVYKGNTSRKGTASFTVKISYDESVFPALKEELKAENIDLAEVEGGIYTLDLFANFINAENIASYTVNGTPHTEGTAYTISNADNVYGEAATEVTFTVLAKFKNDFGSLSYTYTVNVTDTSVFRMQNGGFENGLNGWTGATGTLNSAGTYWNEYSMNNDGQYYDGTNADTETLTSSVFTVGGSGWITFKFGSARPIEGSNLRNVRLEFYEKGDEGDRLIACVRNILFADPEAALKLNDYKLDLSAFKGKSVYVKAVDGESGNDNFRFMILDAFATYWKEAPTDAKFTDLTATRYFNPTARIDLKDTNTVTLNPILSQGLVSESALTATVDKEGLTVDKENPFLLTAVKSGNYTITYKLNGSTAFTANVSVVNTVEIPAFEDMALSVKKGGNGTLNLPAPEDGSRFTYAYAVTANGASVDGNVLSFTAEELAEGTYPVQVSVAVIDSRWGENGDTFHTTFTVTVTVYGEKIIAGDLLHEGKAELSLDEYAVKKETPEAVSVQIDFAKYLIIPDTVNAVYTVTRKIGSGEAAPVTAENGAYALPFADCNLSTNAVTVVFEVTVRNDADETNSVSFTVTVSIKDSTGNRIVNGGFETGNLQGWTVLSGDVDLNGGTSSADHNDWVEKLPYNKSGNYFCNNAGLGEHAAWELKSSSFVLGGNGFISFKMASNTAVLKVYKADGTQIYSYRCHTFNDVGFPHVENGGNWCTLRTHYADLHDFIGEELYITIGNEPAGLSWEFGYFDDIVTYYEEDAVMTGRQDDVLLTCVTGDVSHAPGETVKMNWIAAPNEYVASLQA